jgi:glycosyltransferase involved in cell wall biosynthesis
MALQSLIIPVYKNALNIPELMAALGALYSALEGQLEVILVVDGSPDDSHQLLQQALPKQLFPSQLIELSRNFGSFAAIRQGLELAQGEVFAVMAADLQEPPELIQRFFALLRTDQADLVIGQRTQRSDGKLTNGLSNIYWALYRRFVMPAMPAGGVDVFACNRRVRDDLLKLREANSSLVSQLFWLGHRRVLVPYERRARTQGKSAWNLRRKIRYMLDSVFAFSDLPIFLLLWLGLFGILASLLSGFIVLSAWLLGAITVQGYTPVMLLIAFIGSILIFGQGIIGCYVWRAAENTKQRPLSLIQSQQTYTAQDRASEPTP